jgi:RNA polymerase sigma-70 factor (ECF subfamily)
LWSETALQREERTDEELLRRVVDQDAEAFRELFERHKSRVYSLAQRITGSDEDALDLLQDVFVSIFRQAKTFRFNSKVLTWITSITVHASINASRRAKSRRSVPLAEDTLAPAPEDAFRGERLAKALAPLDPLVRSALLLRYGENMSYDEIADVLGIPVGTVKSRLNRAHEAIREQLKKETGDEVPGRP